MEVLALDTNFFIQQKMHTSTNDKMKENLPLTTYKIVKDEEENDSLFPGCKEETQSTKKKTQRKMLCKFCSLDFKSQSYSDYQDHILTHKNSVGLFECPINL